MPTQYEAVIGLEVHAQLRTQSKILCGCATAFGAPANAQVCPVCLGLPGALPVLNGEAVRLAVLAGLATQCTINRTSLFARKNYFYPDLPKGYQISQAELPLCANGWLDIEGEAGPRRIGIERIHMEEDAGKSVHGDADGGGNLSYINLNRAGVPLIEIVGRPDLRTAEEAAAYVRELRAILVYLGVCDGNMEEGSLRCDANVSVRPVGATHLGTRCEIKNINSFRGIRDAITYEIGRQTALSRAGERIIQQTRQWNQELGRTEAMRSKEEAFDYRYFPDPDLLPLVVTEDFVAAQARALPELPAQKRARLQQILGLPAPLAALLCEDLQRVTSFERALADAPEAKRAVDFANFLVTQVQTALSRSARTWPEVDSAMPVLVLVSDRWRAGELTNKMLSDLMGVAFASDQPLSAALETGLAGSGAVVSDSAALAAAVDAVLARSAAQVAKYRGGQTQLLGYFVGQVMRDLQGKGNAQLLAEILRSRLDGGS
jgi:aspartyl-tRNA(Asn)/glutamyl-tRNA(Gln) amidotransferase subunit B